MFADNLEVEMFGQSPHDFSDGAQKFRPLVVIADCPDRFVEPTDRWIEAGDCIEQAFRFISGQAHP
ncbi:hypothetical protein [Zavarzinia sp. CC-PAN008]|uniref:hypothetical protein n=1 Tax=Zavarzinia sp. CC-PAN008 TaxID=3243332 RepID=UPI003F7427A5